MKKILTILLWLVANVAYSQITITAGNAYEYPNPSGVDYVFIFANVSDAEITYTGIDNVNTVRWSKFDGTLVASGVGQLNPDDATGYILKTATDSITFWVIDYMQNIPIFTNFYVQPNYDMQCNENLLVLEGTALNFEYVNLSTSARKIIYREFKLEWETLTWDGSDWKIQNEMLTLNGFPETLTVAAPFTNTQFKLSGDQFAAHLGLTPDTITTAEYTSIAICDTIIIITETRDALNESERPSAASTISGSAPLDIQFFAKTNANAQYFQWQVLKNDVLLVQRSDKEHRYTFDEAGVYKVKLTISNIAGCTDSTEVQITISESMLQVPNVFTPNGDGKNDEFRVAYKSIVEFHCWVYNRWGRKVFEWTDPARGWDGKINGRNASPGAYFYIISAKGSDGVVYKLKGDINLIGR